MKRGRPKSNIPLEIRRKEYNRRNNERKKRLGKTRHVELDIDVVEELSKRKGSYSSVIRGLLE